MKTEDEMQEQEKRIDDYYMKVLVRAKNIVSMAFEDENPSLIAAVFLKLSKDIYDLEDETYGFDKVL